MSLEARRAPRAESTQLAGTVVVRLVLLFLLVATGLVHLLTTGHEASLSRLVADVQAGRTHQVLVVDDRVVWRTGGLVPRTLELPVHDHSLGDPGPEVYDAAGLSHLLARYPDVPAGVVRTLPGWMHPEPAAAVLGLLTFLLLVAGPDPWRFNRWGWFWLLYVGSSAGIGAVAFLLLSGPLPGRAQVQPARRRTGGEGFGWALVLNLALILLLFGVQTLIGPDTGGWTVRSPVS